MSRELKIIKHCDAQRGHEGEAEGLQTLEVTFDGVAYETDLCAEHAAALRADLAPHLKAAFSRRSLKTPTGTRAVRAENRRIRAWALERKIKVSARGVIPEDVRAAYFDEQVLIAKATKEPPPRPAAACRHSDARHISAGEAAKQLAVPSRSERKAMRAWAAANGHQIGRSGLIPRRVQDAYAAAEFDAQIATGASA